MLRTDRRFWLFAVALSTLAGYVDAIGFLTLDGLFVSFMSGNSTRLAVGLEAGSAAALTAGLLILCFVGGVMGGVLAASISGAYRTSGVLGLVAVLLAIATTLGNAGAIGASTLVMAAAMGAENTVFQRDGEVSIGLTYMTGALVKFGQHLAGALGGCPSLPPRSVTLGASGCWGLVAPPGMRHRLLSEGHVP